MRGQLFSRLIAHVRAELKRTSDAAVGVDDAENLKIVLRRVQNTLYEDHDWPFLVQTFPRITLNAGQRYYEPPEGLNFERIESAAVWFNGLPMLIDRGIGFNEYLAFSSEDGIRSDPALKWEVGSSDDNKDEIEIWPVPASSAQSLQFIGVRKLRPLVDMADVADLDEDLIVLFAAADMHPDPDEAGKKIKQANALLNRLKSRGQTGYASIKLGMGTASAKPRRAVVRVGGR